MEGGPLSDEITLGEVIRRLADVQQTVHDIQAKLDSPEYARRHDVAGLERRVGALESTLTWVVRSVIGVVIVALVAAVVRTGGGL